MSRARDALAASVAELQHHRDELLQRVGTGSA
jgi:hypothetical protein